MIEFRVDADQPKAHLFGITLNVPQPRALQRVSLPVWIPGSYLVREFARHLSRLQAWQGKRECRVEQIDKNSWQVHCEGPAALRLRYEVYAFDPSVRAAYLDSQRGFFNGTSLFLRVEGRESDAHRLRIGALPRGWQVATSMPASPDSTPAHAVHECADYAALVDHPVALGTFWRGQFELRGVPHGFVVTGALPSFDGERLLADTRRICEAQVRFWHGRGKPPVDRYLFMLQAVEDGYGGLEHRNSTALIAARRDLPRRTPDRTTDRTTDRSSETSDGYVKLLGLVSHEYFHTWNVKRLMPREFETIDFERENYTRLLWFFEGFTSYYDDLMLLRCGLIDAKRYLQLLGRTVHGVLATPGRLLQSVADASFDAWVKYYRGDETTPNATISYYTKGSLVALALDLHLRASSSNCLDDVMRLLWQRAAGGPIDEGDIAQALHTVAGRSLDTQLRDWVHGTGELPLEPLLADVGVQLLRDACPLADELGLRLSEGPFSGVQVKSVLRGGVAEQAGVSPGDELLAIDGWRMRRLDEARNWLDKGQPFDLLLVRDQRVLSLRLVPRSDTPHTLSLRLAEQAAPDVQARRRAWLGV
ncbi:MAG: PDZ domain-containing protein [Rubrivivax sp.]